MKTKIDLTVFDRKAYGINEYFCFSKFKVNVDGEIKQHYELRLAPFVIRTEMTKRNIEFKFVIFYLYTAIQFGIING